MSKDDQKYPTVLRGDQSRLCAIDCERACCSRKESAAIKFNRRDRPRAGAPSGFLSHMMSVTGRLFRNHFTSHTSWTMNGACTFMTPHSETVARKASASLINLGIGLDTNPNFENHVLSREHESLRSEHQVYNHRD